MGLLTIRMEEERRRTMRVNDCTSPLLSPPSPNPMLNFPLSPFTMATLLPAGASQYLDPAGNGSADSASIASLSMTPDPFSPFQRLAPPYSPRPQVISSDSTYSGINQGLHPHTARSCSIAEKVSPIGLGAGKGAIDVGAIKYGGLATERSLLPSRRDALTAPERESACRIFRFLLSCLSQRHSVRGARTPASHYSSNSSTVHPLARQPSYRQSPHTFCASPTTSTEIFWCSEQVSRNGVAWNFPGVIDL